MSRNGNCWRKLTSVPVVRVCQIFFECWFLAGLFVDNKHWTRDLREDVDPITVYPIAWDRCRRSNPHRILAVTREYPAKGIQRLQLQLMEVVVEGVHRADRAGFEMLKRWSLDTYPRFKSCTRAGYQFGWFRGRKDL